MKETWIKGCKKGIKEAQEQFYKYYAPRVMGVCRRYANCEEEAEDMFQEAFINIFKALRKYDKIEYPDAWVRKISVNTAINYYKAHKKHTGFLSTDSCYESNNDYEHIIGRLSGIELIALINTLPDGCRIVFNLHAIEGFNHKEIGKMMNISEGTSKSQLARAKGLLKAKLQDLETNIYEATARQG